MCQTETTSGEVRSSTACSSRWLARSIATCSLRLGLHGAPSRQYILSRRSTGKGGATPSSTSGSFSSVQSTST